MKDLTIDEALKLAVEAHSGQERKGIPEPYVLHPIRVALQFTHESPDHRIVAVLHDVFEDTSYTLDQLREDFPLVKADIVQALDDLTRRGKNGVGETHRQYLDRIAASGSRISISVKLADLKDNLRDPWFAPHGIVGRYTAAYVQLSAVAKERGLIIP